MPVDPALVVGRQKSSEYWLNELMIGGAAPLGSPSHLGAGARHLIQMLTFCRTITRSLHASIPL